MRRILNIFIVVLFCTTVKTIDFEGQVLPLSNKKILKIEISRSQTRRAATVGDIKQSEVKLNYGEKTSYVDSKGKFVMYKLYLTKN